MSASANDIAKWLTMILSNGVFNGKRVVDADALTAALSPESQTQPPGDGQGTSNHGSASMSANELRQATVFMSNVCYQMPDRRAPTRVMFSQHVTAAYRADSRVKSFRKARDANKD
ncbi:hypothetical protein [Paraburkholderia hospita]|uniref:hypothetical protein n=1 Tax=Paraburkholderia hospita TaxID=169430 RepID=UPI0008A7E07D|nr:hypothetical protein [Paraburkholderia hospita]SEI22773.1 hypothetical protein SAMN05192544_104480 [Paraburkholderia hospita]